MIRAAHIVFALLVALAMIGPTVVRAEAPFRDLSFEDALELARAEDKVVFVDFFTTWCGPCKRLDQETWPDASVRSWLEERTVAIKIDAEEHETLADRYRVKGYPTLIFIDASGEEIERLVGFLPPGPFLEQAGVILEAGSTDELIELRRTIAYDSGAPARYEFVGLLLRHERHEDALVELVWCYDVGMSEGSIFKGARNTRVMDAFAELASVFEPAREELDRRAIALLRKAVTGGASNTELHDLSAINRAIEREDRTRLLIERLEERLPESDSIGALYRLNRADLLEAGWYERLAKRYPPREELIASVGRWPRTESRIGRMPDADRADARRTALRREIGQLADATEIALGADRMRPASALAERALDLAPDDWYTHHVFAGAVWRSTDRTHDALAYAMKAVLLLEEDPDAETVAPIVRFARIMADTGQRDGALQRLRETLATTADAELREELADAIAEIEGDNRSE